MLLIAKDGTRFLRFDLAPLGGSHREWIGYRLVVGDIDRGELGRLESSSDTPLFLDREVTPEIPELCTGLERACEGVHFSFTPIDERDFELRVEPASTEDMVVSVQARHAPFPDEAGWPGGVVVATESLRRFVAGLRLEYRQIMESVPLV